MAVPGEYSDPIVRVTAGEIRKRIAQYYQEPGHERELKIILPLGAYVPQFFAGEHTVSAPQEPGLVPTMPRVTAAALVEMPPADSEAGGSMPPVWPQELQAAQATSVPRRWLN